MKFLAIASALASLATAARVDLSKRDTPLDLQLEMVGNTGIKASLTNNGESALKVVKTGTILDNAATEKVEVFSADTKVDFQGIRMRISTASLDDAAFQLIQAGETISIEFDIAEMHDLSSGGSFDIVASGALNYAELDSNAVTGAVPYTSNTLTAEVDGQAAAAVQSAFHERARRSVIDSSCTGSKLTATRNAMSSCRSLANAAATAASSGSASKMVEYFKSSSSSVRSTVAGVFQRVASECGSTTSGNARYYCSDVYSACRSGVLAYTVPSEDVMVNCNLYFTALTPLSRTCHAQDQATTTLHEMTHLSQVKGTDDYGVYGYAAVQRLTAAQNLNHADTYTLFANAIYVGC